jgi:hypothetical protein
MRRFVVALVVVAPAVARADQHTLLVADVAVTQQIAAAPGLLAHLDDADLLERRWPTLPTDHAESEEDVITDHLSELGNTLAGKMTALSDQMIGLHVDGRGQRARLRLGTGTGHYLAFKLDSDWYFSDGKARINARVQLGLAGHEVALQLPAMEMEPTSYHGDDGVMLKLPLFERNW